MTYPLPIHPYKILEKNKKKISIKTFRRYISNEERNILITRLHFFSMDYLDNFYLKVKWSFRGKNVWM